MDKRIPLVVLLFWGVTFMVFPKDSFKKFQQAYKSGNYTEASTYIPVLEKTKRFKKHERVDFLNSSINILEYLGDFNKAITYQKELKTYITKPEALYNLNINISDNYCRLGQYNKALELLDSLGLSIPTISRQAYIYYYQDKINLAIQSFSELLSNGDLSASDSASIVHNLGFLYLEKHDWNNAIINLGRSLDNLSPFNKSVAKANLALAYAHIGDIQRAISNINSALEWQKSNLPKGNPEILTTELKKAQVLLLHGDMSAASKIFKHYFSLKKNALLERLNSMSYEDRIAYWNKEKQDLSKCFMLANNSPQFIYDVALFRRLTSILGIHDTELLSEYLLTDSDKLKKSLSDSDATIEFITYKDITGKEKYAAVLLTRNSSAKVIPLFESDFIYEPEIVGTNSIFNAIKRDDPLDKNILYNDSTLGNLVWSPIIKSLPSTVRNIYFAPEGILHFWGIENMPFDHKENFNLHRVSSTAYISQNYNRKNTEPNTLLLGGMNYASIPPDRTENLVNHIAAEILQQKVGSSNIFKFLPGTRSEVDSIASMRNNSTTLYQVGEAQLKEMLPKFDVIHLSTHGYSLNLGIRRPPEFMSDSLGYDQSLNASGLALSGANVLSKFPDREDGLLSAREICDLDLSNVDFVVLSACQTAQGDLTDEGASGLVRGLKNAGVNTVMATLWSVDDKSTMLFMKEFYRLLELGKTKHEAYIGAQDFLKEYSQNIPYRKFSSMTLARENTTRYNTIIYNAPYFWAPFILIDDF